MFPTDVGESKSEYVSKVIDFIHNSGVKYKLTPMATVIETDSMAKALQIVEQAAAILEQDSSRIYSCIKIDYRKDKQDRMQGKLDSVRTKLDKRINT